MNIKKTIASATAAGALLANTALPLIASTQIVLDGNGANSTSYVTYNQTTVTNVNQTNEANVTNDVDVDVETGNNDANFNTGGDVVIATGNAKVDVNIDNILNSNTAHVDCCDQGDTDVLISGNGAYSNNTVNLNQTTVTDVRQKNDARVNNDVDIDADTGDNDANSNTGGDTYIVTGNAHVGVDVSTAANSNSAHVGNNSGSDSNLSLRLLGNGAYSQNWIKADLAKVTQLHQNNTANVTNDVEVDAETGDNDANFNTGGDVVIQTGDAHADVNVDNMLNFNHADVDCGCAWDVLVKAEGNGAESKNAVMLDLDSIQELKQHNFARVDNDIDEIELDTGDNDANSNTGAVDGYSDPAIVTGDAHADVNVSNTLNTNSINSGNALSWPWAGMEFDFSFNMQALLAYLGISMS